VGTYSFNSLPKALLKKWGEPRQDTSAPYFRTASGRVYIDSPDFQYDILDKELVNVKIRQD